MREAHLRSRAGNGRRGESRVQRCCSWSLRMTTSVSAWLTAPSPAARLQRWQRSASWTTTKCLKPLRAKMAIQYLPGVTMCCKKSLKTNRSNFCRLSTVRAFASYVIPATGTDSRRHVRPCFFLRVFGEERLRVAGESLGTAFAVGRRRRKTSQTRLQVLDFWLGWMSLQAAVQQGCSPV